MHIKETPGKHGDVHLSFIYQNKPLHLHLQVDENLTNSRVPILLGDHHKIFKWNSMIEVCGNLSLAQTPNSRNWSCFLEFDLDKNF